MDESPKYKIELVNYVWTCSDGCCSDSGYMIEIFPKDKDGNYLFNIYADSNWKDHRTTLEEVKKESVKILEELVREDSGVEECSLVEDVDFFFEEYHESGH